MRNQSSQPRLIDLLGVIIGSFVQVEKARKTQEKNRKEEAGGGGGTIEQIRDWRPTALFGKANSDSMLTGRFGKRSNLLQFQVYCLVRTRRRERTF